MTMRKIVRIISLLVVLAGLIGIWLGKCDTFNLSQMLIYSIFFAILPGILYKSTYIK